MIYFYFLFRLFLICDIYLMVESLKERRKKRRKITKIIADIKKQCYVFQHVFKLYGSLITKNYTHNKNFNCSIVLAKQIAIYASFTEQLLKILNDNFVIDYKGIMGNKGEELPEEELYPNDDKDVLLTGKCQGLLMKLVSVKDYKSESGVLFAKLVDNLNFLFAQLKPSLHDLDKLVKRNKTEFEISIIYSDFLKYINNPLTYFGEFDEEEEANTSPENTLTYEKRKTQLSEVFSSMPDFDIETVNIEDFGNTKYLERISEYLKDPVSPQSIKIRNFDYKIILTTKNNPAFAKNLKSFYDFLDESFKSFVNLDHTLLMLTIIPEVRQNFTSKIKVSKSLRIKTAFSPNSIPLKIHGMFLKKCIKKKDELPCLTQSACRPDEFPSGELTENVTQNVSEYNSVKFVETPRSTTSKSLKRIRSTQRKGSVKSAPNSSLEYGFRSDNLYGFNATPKRTTAKSKRKSNLKNKSAGLSARSESNTPYYGFQGLNSSSSTSKYSGFNNFNLSGEVSAGKKKKKGPRTHKKRKSK
jgi:hypothetical protein